MPTEKKYQFIYHFVPHPEEKRRATLLSLHAFIVYSFIAGFLFLVLRFLPVAIPGILGYASDVRVDELLVYTNKTREKHGLPSLKLNQSLSVAAQNKANHMFEHDYWAHVSPSGVTPWEFILAQNYDYTYAGENLAKNFNTSSEVVDAWYASASHKENLLNEKYEEIGFGIVNGVLLGYQTTLVVQMFGTHRDTGYLASAEPASQQQAPAPTAPVASPEPAPAPIVEVPSEPVPLTPSLPAPEVSEVPEVDTSQVAMLQESELLSQLGLSEPERNVVVSIDIMVVSKYLLGIFGGFLVTLLVIDVWYSRHKGIPKITGHTFAHITFLALLIGSIWLTMSPGRIL